MFHSRRVMALVPIKEHSERVPGKNFRLFNGKPLYHHILHTLDRTYAVDQIIINTDSARVQLEAPKISRKIRVLERPASLCGDDVSVNLLIEHDLTHSDGELYIQTHATNPLVKPETFSTALKLFVENETVNDSVFSVNCYHSRFYSSHGAAINHNPAELLRTQDLEPVYEENSILYLFTKESFSTHGRRIGARPLMFATPDVESIDIDDEFRFHLAELLAMYASRGEA